MVEALLSAAGMVGLGAALGVAGGVFGFGGGAIAIPLLGLMFGFSQHMAQGTAVVMVVPNLLLSFWRYRLHGHLDMRIIGALAGGAALASYPAARLANGLDGHALRLAFAAGIVLLAVMIAWRALRPASAHPPRKPLRWGWTAVLGIIGGVCSGLFGTGGAMIAPPALTAYFGVRHATAQGMALALVIPGSTIALATYAAAGNVDWRVGIPLAIGGALSVSVGVALAHRLPERRLRLGFSGLLLLTAALLAARS
ncbi:MAG TPA: sulfite exporter TauE/SafE family protein [Stellaceae bacterium]|nr:sulfite exporter TauE/SafE family protein [Stellaceae bacterium]